MVVGPHVQVLIADETVSSVAQIYCLTRITDGDSLILRDNIDISDMMETAEEVVTSTPQDVMPACQASISGVSWWFSRKVAAFNTLDLSDCRQKSGSEEKLCCKIVFGAETFLKFVFNSRHLIGSVAQRRILSLTRG